MSEHPINDREPRGGGSAEDCGASRVTGRTAPTTESTQWRAGTLALSWGAWGGFYVNRGFCPRICVGWLAITAIPVDLDDLMEAYADA